MKIEPLGDAAYIVRDLDGLAYAYADALSEVRVDGVLDVAASYETIGVYFQPGSLSEEALRAALDNLGSHLPVSTQSRKHAIPVCYSMGEDLSSVAAALSLSVEDVARLHASVEYRCFAVGFCPGFPYLGWLPSELQGIPRMPTPRVRTEPGSVAITGKQTAVYPLPTPGGWLVIGRTPLVLVDVEDNYFPIRAGDLISSFSIGEDEFLRLKGERL